ncbi:hypothetical protein MPER_12858 [Moniliophthora perniciosa FA553]|nr:hypothetical protein MPER_12858 [Moniliophthora perniciosa FA553]
MSLIRASLTAAQAIAHHYAMTPPNPTKEDTRYHKEEWWVLQIAPFIFRMHSIVLWVCACFETLSYLSALQARSSMSLFTCPMTADPSIRTTPMFLIGSLALFLGAYIRLDCFRALGHLFTFDLTVHSDHKLITNRFYGYLVHRMWPPSIDVVSVVWAAWWAWVIAVALSRVKAEDAEMKKRFSQQWERYAIEVPWWFFPGIA